MKSSEFIIEGMHEHDAILQNLLKIVNQYNVTGERPLELTPVKTSDGSWWPGNEPYETVSSILIKLGVKAGLNAATTNVEGYQEMVRGISDFIYSMTPNQNGTKKFNRADIADLASTIYQWSERAMKKQSADPYYDRYK